MTEQGLEDTQAAGAALKPLLIDVQEFAALLRVGRTTAFQLIRTKRVSSILIGRSRRIVFADAERLVADALKAEAQ